MENFIFCAAWVGGDLNFKYIFEIKTSLFTNRRSSLDFLCIFVQVRIFEYIFLRKIQKHQEWLSTPKSFCFKISIYGVYHNYLITYRSFIAIEKWARGKWFLALLCRLQSKFSKKTFEIFKNNLSFLLGDHKGLYLPENKFYFGHFLDFLLTG